jgi:hypothetical protein
MLRTNGGTHDDREAAKPKPSPATFQAFLICMPESDAKHILFELPDFSPHSDRKTVTFRRSDMDDPEVQKKLLLVIRLFLYQLPPTSAQPTSSELADALAGVPDSWHYLAFTVQAREECGQRRLRPTLSLAAREPGVNCGDNPVITDIDAESFH